MPKKKNTYSDYLKQEMCDLIEQIELPELQKRFMKSRWLDQLLWLEGRAVKSRNRHYTLRLLTIIGGVIVPALVSVNSAANVGNRRLVEIFGWSAFGISQMVAISAAIEEFFHYGETYRRYRNSAEAMKIEAWQFFQLSGPYKGVQSHIEAYPTFATNVENIIQQDVEGYVSQAAQADEQSKARVQALEQNLALANMQLQEQLRKPPAPIVAESSNYSKVETYQQSSQQVVHDEAGNEFVSSEQIHTISANTTASESGDYFAPAIEEEDNIAEINPTTPLHDTATNSLPNSNQAVGHEEEEDDFVTPDQFGSGQFGGLTNTSGITPTSPFLNSTTFPPNYTPAFEEPESEDDFVSADQFRGSQFGAITNGGSIVPPPTTQNSYPTIPTITPPTPPASPVLPVPSVVPTPPPPPTPQLATPEIVADILQCPLKDTQKYLPGVLAALQEKGILDKPTLIAAIATIGVETGGFCPIHEFGGPKYFAKYDGRKDLGNVKPGDGARYHGRGFIQVTGRANYRRYGELLGLGTKLEDDPELALDPEISAKILACYFYDRKLHVAARASDWRKVRKLVNGGYHGWDKFNNFVQRALQKL